MTIFDKVRFSPHKAFYAIPRECLEAFRDIITFCRRVLQFMAEAINGNNQKPFNKELKLL